MSERKLRAWRDAGLIDNEIVDRIRIWEAAHQRPVGLWAMIGLGALAIGLGVLSVVAANWDAVPGEVRLAIHLFLLAGFFLFLWWYLPTAERKNGYFQDGLLFIAAVLGLTFFGHIGQVYQTSSPLWQPLLAWIVIFSPLMLMFGQGWPIAGLWMVAVLGTAWSHADEYGQIWSWSGQASRLSHPTIYWGLIASPPMLIAATAAWLRPRSGRAPFWRLLEQLAVGVILMGVTIALIARGWDGGSHYLIGAIAIQSLAMAGAAAALMAARPDRSAKATAGVLAIGAILHLLNALIGRAGGAWSGAIFFLALWGAVAAGALFARSRGAFQAAITLIALRIIILSFELSNDLLGSGVGLIMVGAFAMLVAWMTVRIARRYAPETGVVR